jgi:hypothetical protein
MLSQTNTSTEFLLEASRASTVTSHELEQRESLVFSKVEIAEAI